MVVRQPQMPIDSLLWTSSFHGSIEDNEEISLPYEVAHIWAYLLEVGPVAAGAMGAITISYQEISAWMQRTGVKLSPWEVVLLRKCSQEWIHAQYEAKDPKNIPPWNIGLSSSEALSERRRIVAERLKNALGGTNKSKKVKK